MGRTRAFDEQEVLRAAAKRFWDRGYAATSLSDLMEATGLGKGSLYGAFGDKHQLFERIFDNYCADVTRAVEESLNGPDRTAFRRLSGMLTSVADSSKLSAPMRACLLAKATAELAMHEPAIAARARSTFEALADVIVACIKQAQNVGDIRPDRDARQLGNMLLAIFRGIEALAESGVAPGMLADAAKSAIGLLKAA